MAVLSGMWSFATHQLLIAPVRPSKDGPHDLYEIAFGVDGHEVLRMTKSVADEDIGHEVVLRLVRALQLADRLAGMRLPLSLTHPHETNPDPRQLQHAVCRAGPRWLRVIVSVISNRPGRPIRLGLAISFEPRERPPDASLGEYIGTGMECSFAEAKRFALELEEECRQAALLRAEIGVGIDNDVVWDDEATPPEQGGAGSLSARD